VVAISADMDGGLIKDETFLKRNNASTAFSPSPPLPSPLSLIRNPIRFQGLFNP